MTYTASELPNQRYADDRQLLETELAAIDAEFAAHTHALADVTDSGALAALDTVGTAQIDANAVTTAKILNSNVTWAKIENAQPDSLLGRTAAGFGDVTDLSKSSAKTLLDIDALEAKHRIFFQKSSATITLTATPTKVLTASGTLTDHTSSGEWETYDSGTGSADSIRYTGAASVTGKLIVNFNVKHTSADSKPLNFRAYVYANTTLQTAAIPYGATSTINAETVSVEASFDLTLAQNDYINPRAAYINTGNGASTNGQIAAFGYTLSFWEA